MRLKRFTLLAVPRIGRPTGWSGKAASCTRSNTMSSGESSAAAISCRITSRSRDELGAVEARRDDDVAQDVERERQVLAQHARVIGGGVDAGGGVELAAHRLDLLGDVLALRRAVPLKAICSRKCATPCSPARLAAAAGADPDAERDGLDLGHGMTHHGETIGKL